ncbi:MAG: PA2778 family cysteine peptidase [Candidatus Wenzhouxiangella sp. M2_3B_020]
MNEACRAAAGAPNGIRRFIGAAASAAPIVFTGLFAILATGCASFDTRIPESLDSSVYLEDTPFHPQLENHCGPAALMTVLEASGVHPEYQAVADRVFVPGLEGSLQVEMMAAARSFERIPFRVGGTLADVLAEVEAGHPVLILQNLRIRTWPAWHYAVVVGYDREDKRIVMRSGTEREMVTPVNRWMRQWDWAGRWAIVVLPPGELPARPDRAPVLRALADFDERGTPDARLRAWQAAAGVWPDEALVRMGLGNARYAMGDPGAAAAHFGEALDIRPDHWPTRLNLGLVLLETGQPCEGLEIVQAETMPFDHALVETHGNVAIRLDRACAEQRASDDSGAVPES